MIGKILAWLYIAIVGLSGLSLLWQGYGVVTVGGTPYFFLTGALLVFTTGLLIRRSPNALIGYTLVIVYTVVWSLTEVGLDFWQFGMRLLYLCLLALPLLARSFHQGGTPFKLLAGVLGGVIVLTGVSYSKLIGDLSIDPQQARGIERVVNDRVRDDLDWVDYGGGRHGSRYAAATQITPTNVADLTLAWSHRTGVGNTFKNTPIQIGRKLYACGGGNVIMALEAATGEELWRFDARVSEDITGRGAYFSTTCRGVSYYAAPATYQGECPARILMGTTDARLLAVDAETGTPCRRFGDGGAIDLTRHLGEVKPMYYMVTSSPAIVAGNAVVGGWVMDNREVKEPSGVIRAFDALSGQFAWAWDMGRPGVHTEPTDGEVYTRGTPNMWSLFSVDEQRQLLFAPLGNETPDYFGGYRLPESEQFASSVVAIDGATGALQWSFQTTHHDIWDYDVPSQPVLVDVANKDGVLQPAVVVPTKRGEVFLLLRETGEPLAEVTERPAPTGAVPEDWTAPTQPYSALPNPIRDGIAAKDMWGITPFDHASCLLAFHNLRYDGNFTPPNTDYALQFPGNGGGYNWGSVAVHEPSQIMVGNIFRMGNRTRLIPREEMDAGARGSPQLGTPYGSTTRFFMSSIGLPCQAPPYGLFAAIDLQHQTLLWQRRIGTGDSFLGLPLEIGVPNIAGGSIATETGLVFFGAAQDATLRALDLYSGAELWDYKLPGDAQATPLSYVVDDRQFVVLTVPEGASADGLGGHILAFALPPPLPPAPNTK